MPGRFEIARRVAIEIPISRGEIHPMDRVVSLMTHHLDLVLGAGALLVLLAMAFRLGAKVARWRAERRIARNRALGQGAERDAVRVLKRAGYAIETSQASGEAWVRVDGRDAHFTVRADFIARKAGRRFVVEVKSTEATATMANRDTRRQLLEYACAFQVDGALLVDGARSRVHEIVFPQR